MKALLSKLKEFSFFETFKHASVYFIGTILIQGLGLVTLPVYTSFLDDSEYGIVNVFSSYVNIFIVVLSLNLHWSIIRYRAKKDANLSGFVTSITLMSTLLFLISTTIIYIFKAPIARIIGLDEDLILLIILFTYTNIIFRIYLQVKVAEQKSHPATIAEVSVHYLKFIITIAAFFYLGYGHPRIELGKIGGELIAGFLAAIWFFYALRKYWVWNQMSWDHIRYAMSFSLPLIPYAVGGYILISADTWILNSMEGHAEAGLYSFAYKIGLLLFGLVGALNRASITEYNLLMNEKKHVEAANQGLSIYRLMLLGALFLILFAVDVGTLLSGNDKFLKALDLVPVIVGGYLFFGINILFSRAINYTETKNIYLTYIVLLACSLNIVLNLYYIPIYKSTAAAYTTLISYFFMVILSWLFCTFILKLPRVYFGRIMLLLLPVVLISLMYYWLGWHTQGFLWDKIAVKLLVFLIFGFLLFYKTIMRLLGNNQANTKEEET